MKSLFRSLITRFRRWLLAEFTRPVGWYYRLLWNPKPGSLSERLHQVAKEKEQRFFVQIGANDGFQNDPIYKFVKGWGWQGICLEPQPQAFEQLRRLYRKNPVKAVHAAISAHIGSQTLYRISFTRQRWASGLSSFHREQLLRQIDQGYIQAKCAKYNLIPPADQSTWIEGIDVSTLTFEALFQQYDVHSIDLLHIDTEGFDYEVIKLFPFDRLHPEVILYEQAHLSEEDQQEVSGKLTSLGYTLEEFGVDVWAQKG